MPIPGALARQCARLLVVVAAVAGCVGAPAPGATLPLVAATQVRSDLLFGRGKPDGGTVSDAEWRAFVDEEVTSRFPEGLTVFEGRGQYRTHAGALVREPAVLLILLHDGSPASRARVEAIRAAYKRRFDQESVLLIEAPVRVSF